MEDPENAPFQEIESLCTNCMKNGVTRIILTRIPFFRDIIVMSFSCPHCGNENNEVQSGTALADKGINIKLFCKTKEDMNRQVVKSEYATIRVPLLDFEIPPNTQKGSVSTVEGVLSKAARDLEILQDERKKVDQELALKIQGVIDKLRDLIENTQPFEFEIDDPSGSSFIENPEAPKEDSQLQIKFYERTKEQAEAMGFYGEQKEAATEESPPKGADLPETLRPVWDLAKPLETNLAEGVTTESTIIFKVPCANCGQEGDNKVCEVDIPGFRRCLIMAFVCDNCGARTNEVRPSGAIGKRGRKWTLVVESEADLTRDVLKADTAALALPDLDFSMETGSLGGVFTTVEGLLVKIANELEAKHPFFGDSQVADRKEKFLKLIENLRRYASGEVLNFKLILDDPADHSHIGRRYADLLFLSSKLRKGATPDDDEDKQLTNEEYERSFSQNEDLGLNDMKV